MRTVRLDAPLVIGSGVAGLSTALGLSSAVVMTKGRVGGDGSTHLAQGGVAAAIGPDDSPDLHAEDTLRVAAGLADDTAVRVLAREGIAAIERAVEMGVRFDRGPDGIPSLGREAGHSRRRILHASGDATGAELIRTLRARVATRTGITVLGSHRALDLLGDGGRIIGVVAATPDGTVAYRAPAVVLATGGLGALYARTTNPRTVAGDGIALAARAGAAIADLEFVQFHPTALDAGGDPLPLLTEALRGEGAVLVDAGGSRFMVPLHPDAELAPRDVVARAVFGAVSAGGAWLDARPIGKGMAGRFPTVMRHAEEAGLDPRVDPLPVTPAAHYTIGGVAVDLHGATSLDGLYAVGEVARTGVHGANRLASNSLLEGMVFGARVAAAVEGGAHDGGGPVDVPWTGPVATPPAEALVGRLREVLWEHAGVTRDAVGLRAASAWLDEHAEDLASCATGRDAHAVARLLVEAALAREESRGGHHRTDHPDEDPGRRRWGDPPTGADAPTHLVEVR